MCTVHHAMTPYIKRGYFRLKYDTANEALTSGIEQQVASSTRVHFLVAYIVFLMSLLITTAASFNFLGTDFVCVTFVGYNLKPSLTFYVCIC